ncbi:MAG: hypothetical protein KDE27_01495 [Planctomycetes bacterium]|nr:hypothetical protein [Planctomycetota bacterium]
MPRSDSRRPLRLRTKLLLGLATAVFAILAAEFGVRALMPAGRVLSPTAIETFYDRARTEAEMIRADPELGHVPVLGGPVYDEHGLLRDWGLKNGAAKRADVTRYLFLGDSVTRRSTIATPLRALAGGREVEFLNAGVESWNPVQEVEFYFRHQAALAPDHVVLWLHNNDLTESTVACFLDGEFVLCNPGSLVAVDPVWYRRSMLYELWVHSRHVDRLQPKYYTCRATEVEAAIVRLRDEVTGRGARLTIALLPVFAAERDWQPHERAARELELAMLDRLGVEFVDLQPALEEIATLGIAVRATPNDAYHPNDATGAVLARAAAEVLLPAPPVRCTVEPRLVAPGDSVAATLDAGPEFAGRTFETRGPDRAVEPRVSGRGTLDSSGRGAITLAVAGDSAAVAAAPAILFFECEVDSGDERVMRSWWPPLFLVTVPR